MVVERKDIFYHHHHFGIGSIMGPHTSNLPHSSISPSVTLAVFLLWVHTWGWPQLVKFPHLIHLLCCCKKSMMPSKRGDKGYFGGQDWGIFLPYFYQCLRNLIPVCPFVQWDFSLALESFEISAKTFLGSGELLKQAEAQPVEGCSNGKQKLVESDPCTWEVPSARQGRTKVQLYTLQLYAPFPWCISLPIWML